MATPDYLNYILNNPGLRESAEAMGYTQQEMIDMGDWHWNKYGKNESRRNTPFKTELPGERTAQPNPHDIANFEASVRRGDPSEMWTARAAVDPEWNLGQFTGQGWNFDPDNPYVSGILGDTIGVDTGVGQIWSEGDPRFLQDRYIDAAIANDFPVDWVGEEGTWKGPNELAGYWSDITNAIRNEAGDLRAIRDRPATGWAGTEILDVGPRWSGNVRPGAGVGVNQNISGSPSTASLLQFRPWEADYWQTYLPEQTGLLTRPAPQREYSMSYLPGEFRDPATWRKWADGHKGHIPEGVWINNPARWPSYAHQGTPGDNPWRYTAPGGGVNIAQNVWGAPSLSSDAAQKWAGLLSGLDTSPAIDASTQTLLGV